MALTEIEWTDAIFYCEFMAKKKTFAMPQLQDPDKVPLQEKKKIICEYCEMLGDEGEAEIEKTIRTQFAAKGVQIRAALGVVSNWKAVLMSKLTSQTLLGARCFQGIGQTELEKILPAWRVKATGLKLNVMPNFDDNTTAGGVEMWISWKDIQYGAIPTMFALGHEFGHQTDFALRDTHPGLLQKIYPGWSMQDHTSWEYYADTFSIIYLSLISGDRAKLMDAIDEYMKDEPSDGVHPAGKDRVSNMRKVQQAL